MSSMTPSRLGRLLFVCAVAATIHGAARADDALVVTASDLVIAERGKGILRRVGIQDQFGQSAPYERLLEMNGITVENIVATAKALVKT